MGTQHRHLLVSTIGETVILTGLSTVLQPTTGFRTAATGQLPASAAKVKDFSSKPCSSFAEAQRSTMGSQRWKECTISQLWLPVHISDTTGFMAAEQCCCCTCSN